MMEEENLSYNGFYFQASKQPENIEGGSEKSMPHSIPLVEFTEKVVEVFHRSTDEVIEIDLGFLL